MIMLNYPQYSTCLGNLAGKPIHLTVAADGWCVIVCSLFPLFPLCLLVSLVDCNTGLFSRRRLRKLRRILRFVRRRRLGFLCTTKWCESCFFYFACVICLLAFRPVK